MDILQNKKVLAGIIGGVVLMMLAFFVLLPMLSGGGGDDENSPEFAPPPPTNGAAVTAPGGPADMPPGGAPISGASSMASAKGEKPLPPTLAHRPDPFSPLIPKVKPDPAVLLAAAAEREIAAIPPLTIYRPSPTTLTEEGGTTSVSGSVTAEDQPDTSQRRVAGIVAGRNVSAILEVDGQTAVVKPGDVLPDLSRVERIERDRVLLRKGNRAIFVPLSSSPNGPTGGGPVAGGATPYPGGGRRYPGSPPPGARPGG